MSDHAPEPLNVRDYELLAEAALPAGPLGYYAGGAGDERTLRDNVAAWGRRKLRPRVLVDVGTVSTATTVLGTQVATPVLVAPTALQRMAHPDGEPGMARAAAARRDADGPVDALHVDARRGRRRRARRAALDAALRHARPGDLARARRQRAGRRLHRDRRDRRRAGPRAPRTRPSDRVHRAGGSRHAGGDRGARPQCRRDGRGLLLGRRPDGDLERSRGVRGRLRAPGAREGRSDRRRTPPWPASTAPRASSSPTTAAASSTTSARPPTCCPRSSTPSAGASR